jgi:hypothetical protein
LGGVKGGGVFFFQASDRLEMGMKDLLDAFCRVARDRKTAAFLRPMQGKGAEHQIALWVEMPSSRSHISGNVLWSSQKVKGGSIMPKVHLEIIGQV